MIINDWGFPGVVSVGLIKTAADVALSYCCIMGSTSRVDSSAFFALAAPDGVLMLASWLSMHT
jgi:hypothetical protein